MFLRQPFCLQVAPDAANKHEIMYKSDTIRGKNVSSIAMFILSATFKRSSFLNLILPEKTFCNSINSLNNNSPTSDHIILNSSDNTNKNK